MNPMMTQIDFDYGNGWFSLKHLTLPPKQTKKKTNIILLI